MKQDSASRKHLYQSISAIAVENYGDLKKVRLPIYPGDFPGLLQWLSDAGYAPYRGDDVMAVEVDFWRYPSPPVHREKNSLQACRPGAKKVARSL